MTIELIPLCTWSGTTRVNYDLGKGPAGRRIIFEVHDGVVTGERLSGKQVGQVDGDWLLVGPNGVGLLDVRLLIETHDGALVYIQYHGRVDARDPNAPVYSAPTFETSDERYAWLNTIQAVGRGIRDNDILTYEVCEVR